jgi:hypothetical protein
MRTVATCLIAAMFFGLWYDVQHELRRIADAQERRCAP